MSFLTKVMREAEDTSAMDSIARDENLQAILREEGVRAAMQAAARQSNMRRMPPVYQDPAHQDDPARRPPLGQDPEPQIADSGRVVRDRGGLATNNNSPARPDPSSHAADSNRAGPTRVGGDFITRNPAGQPEATMVGRSRPTKPPIRSTKSAIVPEPDQIQSPPPEPRRSSLLEPPGLLIRVQTGLFT